MKKQIIKDGDNIYVVHKTDDVSMGVRYMPYEMQIRGCVVNGYCESNDYDKFMKEYNDNHKCCPVCGEIECRTTLLAFPVNMDEPDKYMDLNSCVCPKCGDRHIYHDRVKQK